VACGPNGTGGLGGHGHNDKLAIEVRVDGQVLIGDPGSGGYTADPALRDRFRGTGMHSTVRVEGAEQQPLPAGRPFALPETAHARCLAFVPGRRRSRFSGEHRGYTRLVTPVVHRREVVLDRAHEALLVTDVLAGEGGCAAESRFLLPAGGRLRPARDDEHARLAQVAAPGVTFDDPVVELGDGAAVLAAAGAASPWMQAAAYADGYGEVRDASLVVFPLAGELPIVSQVVVLAREG
jgi:hypothetical protein